MGRSVPNRGVLVRVAVALALIAAVSVGDGPVFAAAQFTTPPDLLYLTAEFSDALPPVTVPPYPYPYATPGVLAFDGSDDPISGDKREIAVTAADGNCVATAANPVYTGCTSVQMQLTGGTGRLTVGGFGYTGTSGAVADVAGAVVEVSSDSLLWVRGETADVNNALKQLVFTAATGYYYDGTNPATIQFNAQPGDLSGSASHNLELRVLDYNDPLDLAVPGDQNVATPNTVEISTETPADGTPDNENPAWAIDDVDNDENDGDADTDGSRNGVLLVMFATCGWLEVRSTNGFTVSDTIEQVLVNPGGLTPTAATFVADALEAAVPELSSALLASGDPASTPQTGFVGYAGGIGSQEAVNYLLSQVTFHTVNPSNASDVLPDSSCDVWTIVSDVGANGLPFAGTYDTSTGVVEVPWPNVDFGVFTVQVDGPDPEPTTTTSTTVEESTTTSSTVEESTTTSSTVEESTTTSSTVEESTTTSSTVEESTTTSSTVEESTTSSTTQPEDTTTSSSTTTPTTAPGSSTSSTTATTAASTTSTTAAAATTTIVGGGAGAPTTTTLPSGPPAGGGLPATGAEIARDLAVALTLVGLGFVLRRVRRPQLPT